MYMYIYIYVYMCIQLYLFAYKKKRKRQALDSGFRIYKVWSEGSGCRVEGVGLRV